MLKPLLKPGNEIQMNEIESKIKMMEGSFQCFAFGLLGLLPIIGIPFGIVALLLSGRVLAGQRRFWNPARPYWLCGIICAWFGLILWGFVFFVMIWRLMNPDPYND